MEKPDNMYDNVGNLEVNQRVIPQAASPGVPPERGPQKYGSPKTKNSSIYGGHGQNYQQKISKKKSGASFNNVGG